VIDGGSEDGDEGYKKREEEAMGERKRKSKADFEKVDNKAINGKRERTRQEKERKRRGAHGRRNVCT
jgi:hypothetical protein